MTDIYRTTRERQAVTPAGEAVGQIDLLAAAEKIQSCLAEGERARVQLVYLQRQRLASGSRERALDEDIQQALAQAKTLLRRAEEAVPRLAARAGAGPIELAVCRNVSTVLTTRLIIQVNALISALTAYLDAHCEQMEIRDVGFAQAQEPGELQLIADEREAYISSIVQEIEILGLMARKLKAMLDDQNTAPDGTHVGVRAYQLPAAKQQKDATLAQCIGALLLVVVLIGGLVLKNKSDLRLIN